MTNKSLSGNLHKASVAKKDEFYTQLADIEKELKHYKDQFRDKVIFCNCDDPFESNFFKYFAANFNSLKLKKLIATSYKPSPITGGQLPMFEMEGLKGLSDKEPFKIEINEVPDVDKNGATGLSDVEWLLRHDTNASVKLKGDRMYHAGDFRSKECVKLLEEADIVVTNPPFSLFREYVAQLMEHNKKFLILGSQNAITYKETFRFIKENRMWLGYDNGGTKWFQVPNDYDIPTESRKKVENGIKYFSMGSVVWFTNLDTTKRHEEIVLYKKHNPEEYPKYDNYDAIEISKVADIPMNWNGLMGVPITFLDKYNPSQFEIVELGNSRENFTPNKDYLNPKKHTKDGKIVNGGAINCVLAIEVEKEPYGSVYYTSDNSKYLIPPYARIIIKNK